MLKSLKPSCGSIIRTTRCTAKRCSNPHFSLGSEKHAKVFKNTKYDKGEFKSPSNENLVFHQSSCNTKGSELHKPNRSLVWTFPLCSHETYNEAALCIFCTMVTSFSLATIYEDIYQMLTGRFYLRFLMKLL